MRIYPQNRAAGMLGSARASTVEQKGRASRVCEHIDRCVLRTGAPWADFTERYPS